MGAIEIMKTKHRIASRAKRSPGRYQADPSSIYRLMNKLQPFTDGELLRLNMPVRMSYESIRSGQGVDDDFHTLAAAINTAMVRSETIDDLCVKTCQIAQAALFRCIERHHRLGAWGFDALALQEIPAAIELHESILELSTPVQMQDAMREVLVRQRQGNVYEMVRTST
jgi:hypothetical protein